MSLNLAREYVEAAKARVDMPADPDFSGDLSVARIVGETVYSVLPLTAQGFRFVVDHHEAGVVDGDTLRVPMREIFPLMNDLFDEGLRVV